MSDSNALLLVNPKSRSGAVGVDDLVARLEQGGLTVFRESPGSPEAIAPTIADYRGHIDRVVVGGGDGTMNAALVGVLGSGLPMAVLPLGTANDFARSLGLPLDPLAACDIAVGGRVRRVDLGEVNGRYFLNVAHIGLAVAVARHSNSEIKRRLGVFAYPVAAWRAFRRRRTFVAHIRGDGGWQRIRAVQISVGNGRFYGGGIPVAEDATIDDGRLDLYAIPAQKGSALLAMLPALRSGRAHMHQNILSLSGKHFEVVTHRPKRVSVDGESTFTTPLIFRMHAGALPVFTPRGG